ncbi:sugar-binding domain-containing protein [Anaeromicropila herbilytica]|uniref:beta-galactosidase n=1 Tax=Anaeromicropila herbilytica TaxID=2785025 RepID=A0A7R7ICU5_9FIRM|nr:sugar-binding domain-containing protein [Anaeromicropila herbilytica]BCN29348.1 beta-galactosidase [Anaeromicropila herbilytica]
MKRIDLKGSWGFRLDKEKTGIDNKLYNAMLEDSIDLPATVSTAMKGVPSEERNTGYLTDPYHFEGYTWYSREVDFTDSELNGEEKDKVKEYFLVLERTRISHVWVDDNYVGSNNSLCSSHRYRITPYIKDKHKITIMVDNTSYPVPGGHMASPDTQTNWNGITGEIYIEESSQIYLTGVKISANAVKKQIEVKVNLNGIKGPDLKNYNLKDHSLTDNAQKELDPIEEYYVIASVMDQDAEKSYPKETYTLQKDENTFIYNLDDTVGTWSEHSPKLYCLHLELRDKQEVILDEYDYSFGFRDFRAVGKYFEINGMRTFLRGKHDGMIFPVTGHAPTDVESWLKVLTTAKEYGVNHYRFHTCCPPEAAFEAADQLGIYMEPELPFWGTVTDEKDENHDEEAQRYLIEEGYRILDEFGNHPSFVMMSLGNELWGSKERLNHILLGYRNYDSRHLYTSGSNNFQFMPCILENEDFFVGVRFSRDRLFRGSYAMCDAPQGYIQTMAPTMSYNYDQMIRPSNVIGESATSGEVTIQYGTGTKTVKMDASEELIPEVPVVSHEVGQYAMYPDFSEIEKYTGVLKARNMEVFRERLEEKGMLHKAEQFFKASGRFAAECYKAEVEAALKSNELAGFQLLDLQDFTGQGTALIGILNSFMENKGVISPEEWRQFCSDSVLLAELPKMIYHVGEIVDIGIKLAVFSPEGVRNPKVKLSLMDGEEILAEVENSTQGEYLAGVYSLGELKLKMPQVDIAKRLVIRVIAGEPDSRDVKNSDIKDSDLINSAIKNSYDICVFPEIKDKEYDSNIVSDNNIIISENIIDACEELKKGKKVLLYPGNLNDTNSIEGTYCTDFWCYPMFRSISESMKKPVPIGTHGLLIQKEHPVFKQFPTEYYSTPEWYDIVENSRALILDGKKIEPIVWTIDNFERNHKLGNIFEVKVGDGKLLVCTSNLRRLTESDPAKWLEHSILKYMSSEKFEPVAEIQVKDVDQLF